jgi:hypothetical protein
MSDYTGTFATPILNWLSTNPTKRPRYVILFQDLPSLILLGTGSVGVQYDMVLSTGTDPLNLVSNYPPSWMPLVTSINMNGTGGTDDCTAYIDKIVSFASNSPAGTLFISAAKNNYGNTNWYFDGDSYTAFATEAAL